MRLAAVIAILGLLSFSISAVRAEAPKVGDKAPDFKLKGSDGKEYSLSQFAGKKTVVIAWFPKAFTSGCTAQCKSMKEDGEAIRKFDVAYFTASIDDVDKNTAFAKSLGLDFPILSDPASCTPAGLSPSAGPSTWGPTERSRPSIRR